MEVRCLCIRRPRTNCQGVVGGDKGHGPTSTPLIRGGGYETTQNQVQRELEHLHEAAIQGGRGRIDHRSSDCARILLANQDGGASKNWFHMRFKMAYR